MKSSKFITVFILIASVIGIIWYIQNSNLTSKVSAPVNTEKVESTTTNKAVSSDINKDTEKATALKAVNSTTIRIPDEDTATVTLKNGQGDFSLIPNGPMNGFAQVVPESVTVNSKNKSIASVIDINTGGTGIFSYLFLFKQNSNSLDETSFYFLGDRIKIQNVQMLNIDSTGSNYTIEVTYLDRKDSDAYSDNPSISKILTINVSNNKFVDLSAKVR